MPALFGEFDVVRVRLKDADSASADPFHWNTVISALGQTGDLRGRPSHTTGCCPRLNACNKPRITPVCFAPLASKGVLPLPNMECHSTAND